MAQNRASQQRSCRKWVAKNPEHMMWLKCRNRARAKGQACELTLDDVKELCSLMRCSVTGIQLSWTWDGEGENPWAPSIDRLNNSVGYIKGNIRLVCWAFNKARSTWPDEVFDRIARAYVRAR